MSANLAALLAFVLSISPTLSLARHAPDDGEQKPSERSRLPELPKPHQREDGWTIDELTRTFWEQVCHPRRLKPDLLAAENSARARDIPFHVLVIDHLKRRNPGASGGQTGFGVDSALNLFSHHNSVAGLTFKFVGPQEPMFVLPNHPKSMKYEVSVKLSEPFSLRDVRTFQSFEWGMFPERNWREIQRKDPGPNAPNQKFDPIEEVAYLRRAISALPKISLRHYIDVGCQREPYDALAEFEDRYLEEWDREKGKQNAADVKKAEQVTDPADLSHMFSFEKYKRNSLHLYFVPNTKILSKLGPGAFDRWPEQSKQALAMAWFHIMTGQDYDHSTEAVAEALTSEQIHRMTKNPSYFGLSAAQAERLRTAHNIKHPESFLFPLDVPAAFDKNNLLRHNPEIARKTIEHLVGDKLANDADARQLATSIFGLKDWVEQQKEHKEVLWMRLSGPTVGRLDDLAAILPGKALTQLAEKDSLGLGESLANAVQVRAKLLQRGLHVQVFAKELNKKAATRHRIEVPRALQRDLERALGANWQERVGAQKVTTRGAFGMINSDPAVLSINNSNNSSTFLDPNEVSVDYTADIQKLLEAIQAPGMASKITTRALNPSNYVGND